MTLDLDQLIVVILTDTKDSSTEQDEISSS